MEINSAEKTLLRFRPEKKLIFEQELYNTINNKVSDDIYINAIENMQLDEEEETEEPELLAQKLTMN